MKHIQVRITAVLNEYHDKRR